MNERERRLIQREALRTPERWIPQFAVITISGPSGVGKTTIAGELAKRYGIPEERNIKTGQRLREETGKTNEIGFIERSSSVDKELDEMQAEKMINATLEEPIILEGRLAGFIAERLKTGGKLKFPVIRFLLTANSDVRHRRIWERLSRTKSFMEIRRSTQQREEEDRKHWRKIYPLLPHGDPFIPGAKDKSGKDIYDEIISTNHKNVAEVEAEIHNFLKERGLVRRG